MDGHGRRPAHLTERGLSLRHPPCTRQAGRAGQGRAGGRWRDWDAMWPTRKRACQGCRQTSPMPRTAAAAGHWRACGGRGPEVIANHALACQLPQCSNYTGLASCYMTSPQAARPPTCQHFEVRLCLVEPPHAAQRLGSHQPQRQCYLQPAVQHAQPHPQQSMDHSLSQRRKWQVCACPWLQMHKRKAGMQQQGWRRRVHPRASGPRGRAPAGSAATSGRAQLQGVGTHSRQK